LLKEDYEPNQDLISSTLLVLLHEVTDAIRVTPHNRKVQSVSGLRGTAVIYLTVWFIYIPYVVMSSLSESSGCFFKL